MPRAKRKYIVAITAQECETEAEALESYKDITSDGSTACIYSVTGAQELKPVMRLEKLSGD